MNIQINEKFKTLIPALSENEYELLKESIIKEGLRDKLVVWGDVLVDGHNRYRICTEYNIPYQTVSMEFADEQEAEAWILRNQLGRRNLTDVERARIVLELKDKIAERAKERQIANLKQNTVTQIFGERQGSNDLNNIPPNFGECSESLGFEKGETLRILAKEAGLSHETLRKVEKVDSIAPKPIKQAMGKIISIDKAYQMAQKLNEIPPDEQETEAERILQEEIDRQFKRIDTETKIYNKLSDIMIIVPKYHSYITEENVEIYIRLMKGSETIKDIVHSLDLSINDMIRLRSMFESRDCIRRLK